MLSVLAVVPLVAGAGAAYLLRDPLPRFVARRSSLATVIESAPSLEGAYSSQPVRLVGQSGLTVELELRRPRQRAAERLPLVVILGGHYTGRDAARLVGDVPGVIIAALSYPFTGDPRPSAATFLREIPKIRAAFLDTPP